MGINENTGKVTAPELIQVTRLTRVAQKSAPPGLEVFQVERA